MPKRLRIARLLFIVTALAASGWGYPSLTPPAKAATGESHPVVALLLGELNPRWLRDYLYLKSRLHSLYSGAVLYVYNAADDPVRQLGQADEALGKGAKVLIVVAVDPTDAATIVTRAHRERAMVIAYDHTIRSRQVDLFDSFDAAGAGKAQAGWLATHVRRGGTVVIVNGPIKGSNSQVFQKSYLAILGPRFRSHYFRNGGEYWSNDWSAERGSQKMDAALKRNHNSVQGVLAADDDLADGVIASLERAGLQGKAHVTGQDATVDALRHILQGEQGMTLYKPVYDEAYAAAAAADAFLRGKPLPIAFRGSVNVAHRTGRILLFQAELITQGNVREALSDGLVTKKEVCKGIPRKLCAGL
jgi:D-xylose transport system substrate-binding protein